MLCGKHKKIKIKIKNALCHGLTRPLCNETTSIRTQTDSSRFRVWMAILIIESVGISKVRKDSQRIKSGLGSLRNTTNIKRLFARLSATYRRQRVSSLSGKVFVSQGITITLSHSSPFAL